MCLLRHSMISNESYIFLAVFAGLALVALVYLLSPEMSTLVKDITKRGAEFRERVDVLLRRYEYPNQPKEVLMVVKWVSDEKLTAFRPQIGLSLSNITGQSGCSKRPSFTLRDSRWCGRCSMRGCERSGSMRLHRRKRSSEPVEAKTNSGFRILT